MKRHALLISSTLWLMPFTPSVHADPPKIRIAQELTARYENTTNICKGSMPAYMCSGIMLRALDVHSRHYDGWEPSAFSEKSGATSFTFLRADLNPLHLALNKDNGFILFAEQRTPKGLLKPEARCFFIHDADTYERDDSGCGAHRLVFTQESDLCDNYNIASPEQWYTHYTRVKGFEQRRRHECGFRMMTRSTAENARKSFNLARGAYQMLQGHRPRGEEASFQNEFRLTTWPKHVADQLPIQAFFYLNASNGRGHAQKNQRDFFVQTHRFVPIVRITMPPTPQGTARFHFFMEDQYINPRLQDATL